MPKCPHCGFKSNKVEVTTTEVGQVRWLNPKLNKDGTIEELGSKWVYEGGETDEEKPYKVICKKCGEVINEIS